MKRKNRQSGERAAKREGAKINTQLQNYIEAFMKICYFQEEKLDWNVISEDKYQSLNRRWKAWCRRKGYSDHISKSFEWNALLLKADLILGTKHKLKGDADKMYALIQKGKSPEQVADYAAKNFQTEPIL